MDNPDTHVEIVDHDPGWTGRFESERSRITPALQHWLNGEIEHVGSTAVPGLAAKPVIDMVAPVKDHEQAIQALTVLHSLGYLHWTEDPHRAWRHWLLSPSPQRRIFHLYLMERTEPEYSALLAFRDHLRTDQKVRDAYAEFKRSLLPRFADDREEYTRAKTRFISRAFEEMGLALPHPR